MIIFTIHNCTQLNDQSRVKHGGSEGVNSSKQYIKSPCIKDTLNVTNALEAPWSQLPQLNLVAEKTFIIVQQRSIRMKYAAEKINSHVLWS